MLDATDKAKVQPLFTTMVRGLAKQEWRQAMAHGACEYRASVMRNSKGEVLTTKCAIGQVISDESASLAKGRGFTTMLVDGKFAAEDRPVMEALSIHYDAKRLGALFQEAHDNSDGPDSMARRFHRLSVELGLDWPEDVPVPVTSAT